MRVVAHTLSLLTRRSSAVALLLLGGLAGCLDLKTIADACTVTVAPTTLSLAINRSSPIVGTAFDCSGNSIRLKKITYSTSNPAVATVTAEGTVLAIAVGTTSIAAVADGKSASVQVTVTPEQAATVTLNPSTLTLRKTNQRRLTATARSNQGIVISGAAFRWSSSNTAIASVDQSGNVTALTAGQVVVTGEVDQVVGQAQITVTEIPIGSCSLSPATSKVTVTQTVQPTLTLRDTANNVIPSQGRPIVWSSSNEGTATVSPTGLVTTRKAGTAQISASPAENAQVSCSVSVEAVDPRIAQVVITPRAGALRLGIPRGFSATLLDSTSSQIPPGRAARWSTNTPQVVNVSQAGIVTALTLGTARIIATAEDVADTVTLNVTRIPVGIINVTPIQSTLFEGQTAQLRAVVNDSTGEVVTDRALEWISSDPSRATVSGTGFVTAITAGVVTISATSEQRAGQASISVQQIAVDSIVVLPTATVERGTSSALAMTLLDARGAVIRNRNVIVSSSAPGVVTGVPNGQATQLAINGINGGTAILTLQAVNANGQNDGRPSRVTVTVTTPVAEPTVDTILVPTSFTIVRGTSGAFAISPLDVRGNAVRNRAVVVSSDLPGIAFGQANSPPTSATVNALAVGTAIFTVQAVNAMGQNEGKASRVRVTVIPPTAEPTVDTIIVPTTFSLERGTSSAFEIRPLDAQGNAVRNRAVVVTSDLPGVAFGQANSPPTFVQANGLVLGTATFTIQAVNALGQNEGKASKVRVTVTPPPSDPTVDSILVPATFSVVRGSTSAFAISPVDARGNLVRNRTVIVSSDLPGIAVGQANTPPTFVTASGLAVGTATFTIQAVNATGQNEGKASRVRVTVTSPLVPVDTIVSPTTFTLVRGSVSAFAITLLDASGNQIRNRNVLVTSNLPSIASGQSNALSTQVNVTGFLEGEAILTLQVVDENDVNQGKVSRVRIVVTRASALSAPMPPATTAPPVKKRSP
jgi:uncharacterized protein YjdB